MIVETEKALPHQHLLAQNIANEKARIERPNPAVSIFNFHYAAPPATVGMNYALGKAIGDDETGFRGVEDRPYRIEAWDFLIAGGALFDHLDYSFTTDHEDGTAPVVAPTPGGGGPAFRAQLQILKRFIEGFDFVKMAPDGKVIARVVPAIDLGPRLSEPGKAYAIYVHGGPQGHAFAGTPRGPLSGRVAQSAQRQDRDVAGDRHPRRPSRSGLPRLSGRRGTEDHSRRTAHERAPGPRIFMVRSCYIVRMLILIYILPVPVVDRRPVRDDR